MAVSATAKKQESQAKQVGAVISPENLEVSTELDMLSERVALMNPMYEISSLLFGAKK